MPSYRPPISIDNCAQLEHYLFGLVRYTKSMEFINDMDSKKQRSIYHEITYIQMSLQILNQLFEGNNQLIPVVGWDTRMDPLISTGYYTLYHFSSAAIAARCLNLNPSHIGSVCREERKHTGGWVFQYESQYDIDKDITFSSFGAMCEIIKRNG